MGNYVLIIDHQNGVESVVETALDNAGVAIVCVIDAPSAKRRIVLEAPALIVCSGTINGDEEFGFRFCQELSGHSSFSQIPVMLLCDRVDGSIIDRASASGARGLIPWPIEPAALRLRLTSVLPQLKDAGSGTAAPVQSVKIEPPVKPEKPAAAKPAASPPPDDLLLAEDSEAKFKLAQHLLAKVLHSLKTSNLLDVVDEDELPAVLLEMTKKVISEHRPAGTAEGGAGCPEKSTSIGDVFQKKR